MAGETIKVGYWNIKSINPQEPKYDQLLKRMDAYKLDILVCTENICPEYNSGFSDVALRRGYGWGKIMRENPGETPKDYFSFWTGPKRTDKKPKDKEDKLSA